MICIPKKGPALLLPAVCVCVCVPACALLQQKRRRLDIPCLEKKNSAFVPLSAAGYLFFWRKREREECAACMTTLIFFNRPPQLSNNMYISYHMIQVHTYHDWYIDEANKHSDTRACMRSCVCVGGIYVCTYARTVDGGGVGEEASERSVPKLRRGKKAHQT